VNKLHLGCGQHIIDGFINTDLYHEDEKVVKCDARDLPYKNGEVDLIYICHVLEHFSRHEIIDVLKEWNRVLKSGGEVYISVPDFEAVVDHYNENKDIVAIQGLLNGGQTCEWNKHTVSFDFDYLEKCLLEAGFDSVKRYDWRDSIFSGFDDYSKSYLPHMDKENGMLMSLNVVAVK